MSFLDSPKRFQFASYWSELSHRAPELQGACGGRYFQLSMLPGGILLERKVGRMDIDRPLAASVI